MSRQDLIKAFGNLIKPPSSTERAECIADISQSAQPGFDYFFLVILSCSIATMGLVIDSPAVIIGAMLLAPLMSPIIGIGLASITGNHKLAVNSASALFKGAIIAILLSALMTLLNRFLPFVSLHELPKEVLARTHPTPIDLVIALAGGLAAAYAMTRPNLSATLPGVAIATALMPPLSTIGIGIALARWDVAGGASLLFITNAITIAFASALIFFLRGFAARTKKAETPMVPRSLWLSALLVLVIMIPLTYFGVKFFREASENRLINEVVTHEVASLDDARLVDIQVRHLEDKLAMEITIRTSKALRYEEVVALQEAIVNGINRPVSLKIDQILAEELDPLIPPTPTRTPTNTTTPTPGPSQTPSPTSTAMASATPMPTATPAQAMAKITGLPPMQIYQSPGGPVIGQIKPGQWLTILYGRLEYMGMIWVEVIDPEGRLGWMPEIFLVLASPTPSP